jgi:hypothetical protein
MTILRTIRARLPAYAVARKGKRIVAAGRGRAGGRALRRVRRAAGR